MPNGKENIGKSRHIKDECDCVRLRVQIAACNFAVARSLCRVYMRNVRQKSVRKGVKSDKKTLLFGAHRDKIRELLYRQYSA